MKDMTDQMIRGDTGKSFLDLSTTSRVPTAGKTKDDPTNVLKRNLILRMDPQTTSGKRARANSGKRGNIPEVNNMETKTGGTTIPKTTITPTAIGPNPLAHLYPAPNPSSPTTTPPLTSLVTSPNPNWKKRQRNVASTCTRTGSPNSPD